MKTAIVTGSLLLGLAGHASAQPGRTEPVLDPESAPLPAPIPAGEQLNESTAFALSLGGAIGSWSLLLGAPLVGEYGSTGAGALMGTLGAFGTLLTPSFGQWYAEQGFTRGLGLRLGGAAVALLGALTFVEVPTVVGHDDPPEEEDSNRMGSAILITGLAVVMWGTIDDVARVRGAARRRNRELAGADIALTPLVTHQSAGFALGGRF